MTDKVLTAVPFFPNPADVAPPLRWNGPCAPYCTLGGNLDAFDELPPATRAAFREALFDRNEVVLATLWVDGLMTDDAMAEFVRRIDARDAAGLAQEAWGSDHPAARFDNSSVLDRMEAKLASMIADRLAERSAPHAPQPVKPVVAQPATGLDRALQKLRRSVASNPAGDVAA